MHENLIKLLSEALKFYAEEANYVNDQMNKDRGYQARFVLNLVKMNEEQMKSLEQQYIELKENSEKTATAEDLVKMIDEMRNIE